MKSENGRELGWGQGEDHHGRGVPSGESEEEPSERWEETRGESSVWKAKKEGELSKATGNRMRTVMEPLGVARCPQQPCQEGEVFWLQS